MRLPCLCLGRGFKVGSGATVDGSGQAKEGQERAFVSGGIHFLPFSWSAHQPFARGVEAAKVINASQKDGPPRVPVWVLAKSENPYR